MNTPLPYEPGNFTLPKGARRWQLRGGAARAAQFRYRIGDETLTAPQVAARLGIARDTAASKIKHATRPLTLEGIAATSSNPNRRRRERSHG